MFSFFHNLIIFPLTQVLEFFYEFIFEATGNEFIAIIALSFVVTLCTLPLYMVAENWQETERNLQKRLKPGIKRIKKAFKGDEQYMILNTFYKQNNYSPIMALRSSLTLLIQIPFFLAAYHFISELGSLKGVSFWFLKDLASPDSIVKIGTFTLNILPITMTIINCISGAIYSSGHPVREKVQIYAMASIFLLVLYNSPSALVVYWTMNNILSLTKNIFYKIKNPKKVLYIILCIFSFICLIAPFTVLKNSKDTFKKAIFFFAIILPALPFAIIKLSDLIDKNFQVLDKDKKLRNCLFFSSAISLAILAGLLIPSTIIESEPNNYCYVDGYSSPFIFLRTVFFQSAGVFLFWGGLFYLLFSDKIKKILTIFFLIASLSAFCNSFLFGGQYGPIEPWLEFMQPQNFTPPLPQIFLNLLCLVSLTFVVIFSLTKFSRALKTAGFILIFSMVVFSARNSAIIQREFSKLSVPSYTDNLEPIFHLSKTNKNVLVLMQDRCFSPFFPYIFEELPSLEEKLDGFVFYPNTISFGKLTMVGTPGLFGGYDYTPYRINERALEEPEKTLQDKHNEAMLTLPLIFTSNGYRAEVANLPYENYLEQPESNMYLKNKNLQKQGFEVETHTDPSKTSYIVKYKRHEPIRHNHTLATYTNYWYAKHDMKAEPYISSQIFRNFIWFSLFKMVPPFLRGGIYHRDYWLAYNKWDDSARFIDNYSVIDYLPELTKIDEEKGTLILLDNEATHEPVLLQAPNYDFRKTTELTNLGNSPLKNNPQFSTMCGIFLRLSEFFDYLKENDVYDNTKIIIVSDHGMYFDDEDLLNLNSEGLPFQRCNYLATLLVKDFNSRGRIKTENTFMTNADTPYLATKDVIENAIHPFTGKKLEVKDKNSYSILSTSPAQSTRIRHQKKFDVADNQWYTVKDDVYDKKNWSQLKK